MSRHDWTFEVPAMQLRDAAAKKIQYHSNRHAYWEEELETTEEEMLKQGLKVKKYSVTGGMRRELTFDSVLERRYHEAGEKLDRHQAKIDVFGRFFAALEEATGRSFKLTIDDWEFFGL